MKKYDIVVIGGGAGGLTVAAGAAGLGASVALIEKEKQPGGDCLHYGCVPSKALLQAAKEVYNARKAAKEFGLHLSGDIDFGVAKKRVIDAQKIIEKHDSVERFENMGVDVYHGEGSFITRNEIQIASQHQETMKIWGKRIVIATGSRPSIPAIEGLETVEYITNETIFDLDAAPKRLAVIGGGPIGLEMAQAFSRLGSEVNVFVRSNTILAKEDKELIPVALQELEKEMIFHFQSQVTKVEPIHPSGSIRLHIQYLATDDKNIVKRETTLEVDQLLIAAGRTSNIESLGLEKIGVETQNGHVLVKDTLQTSVSNIFAVGDIIGKYLFTHAAGMEGKAVIANAVFGLRNKAQYDSLPWVTYTDPEIYHLGLTEDEARCKHVDNLEVYKVNVDDVDRFVTDRQSVGILKVITDKKGFILGAHAVGKGASTWMQELVYAKQYKHPIGNVSKVIHPYPTHGAILQRAADQYWRKKLFSGFLPKLAKKYIQWFR
ncbi:pyridine nucleotide-disulfide oxidoreductase [Desulfuribacillus stibiiarsenatis]|uniref:Pyridine nucleotide-disulfide oxidoreductase n=1 Tax=Desulfuribacillus stibiiarsenatis TaxID=1390249 RepID=A0A1E5L8X0_9FIRM|nr:FAD-dependent oxidoreductase [Desulfuribacillus stibiiarsenatis]OEH86595.1 pyridine nucleotide-disulfide oxidoreductase [Desulfuribacillus stibiiarsenatis]